MKRIGRISKIPYIINIPYHTNSSKKSTSDILRKSTSYNQKNTEIEEETVRGVVTPENDL